MSRNADQMFMVRTIVVAVAFVVTAMYLATTSKAEELPPRQPLALLPMTIDGWNGRREADFSDDVEKVLGVDDYITRTYTRAGQLPLGLYIGYHTSQREGDTIHSPLNCLPGAGWLPVEQIRTRLTVPTRLGGEELPIDVNEVVIQKGVDRALVVYWYQSHRRVVASEYWGKIYTVLDSVRYNRTDAAMVRIVVPLQEGQPTEAGYQYAGEFAKSLFPLLAPHLPS